MPDAHKNAAISAVVTVPAPATSGLTLVVTTGEAARFPTPPFMATVWPRAVQPMFDPGSAATANFEIVRVTAISTNTLTIVRAQEGTTARAILAGDQIAATITAQVLVDAEGAPFQQTVGDGTATTIDVTHNGGTRDLTTIIRQTASPYAEVYPRVEYLSVNAVRLIFDVAPSAGQYTVAIFGKAYSVPAAPAHATNHNPGGADSLNYTAVAGELIGTTSGKVAAGDTHSFSGVVNVASGVLSTRVAGGDTAFQSSVGAAPRWKMQAYGELNWGDGAGTFDTNLYRSAAGALKTDGALTVAAGAIAPYVINAQTGTTYTLVLADQSKMVTLSNASAIALTIPTNASVAFPIGTTIDLLQIGAGAVTVSGAGVSINPSGKLRIATQWTGASIVKIATDTWVMYGGVA